MALPRATPESRGLHPEPIADAVSLVTRGTSTSAAGPSAYAGAVGVMVAGGAVVGEVVAGSALRYAADGPQLPRDDWEATTSNTLFDLASLSKLFTAIAAMQLVEESLLSLDEPAARHLPEFATDTKQLITVRHLLQHTSGLPAERLLWRDHPDAASRLDAALREPLESAPGAQRRYSDLGMIALGELVTRCRRAPLNQVVRQRITGPLIMHDTAYGPVDARRAAATEIEREPSRGLVRGEVHDENAWSLGGVAGHAGLFSTADDLALFAQALIDAESCFADKQHAILRADTISSMVDQGLGFEVDQPSFMGDLAGPRTIGHTGFTGTSIVVDLERHVAAVLLTNRVHPARTTGTASDARRQWANGLAASLRA